MRLKSFFLLFISISIFLSACKDDDISKDPVIERTVLVYIAADNSLSSFASADLAEMLEGIQNATTDYAKTNNFLVYIDNRSGNPPQLLRLTRDKKNKAIKEVVVEYPSRNSVGVSEMKEVLSYVYTNYTANSYGLVLWSHGEGWVKGNSAKPRWWGQDAGDGNNLMDISDLHQVLNSSAPHLEFILFDCCFMGSAEVLYELKDCADYFVASPTEIPGPGAPYQMLTKGLFAKTNPAKEIAKAYFDYYKAIYTGQSPAYEWTAGVSVGVIESKYLSALAEETAKIIPKYIVNQADIDVSGIMCYDRRSSRYYYDICGFIESIASMEEYRNWKAVYDMAVPYYATTEKNYSQFSGVFPMEGSNGLSIYLPDVVNSFYHTFKWYKDCGWEATGW